MSKNPSLCRGGDTGIGLSVVAFVLVFLDKDIIMCITLEASEMNRSKKEKKDSESSVKSSEGTAQPSV